MLHINKLKISRLEAKNLIRLATINCQLSNKITQY